MALAHGGGGELRPREPARDLLGRTPVRLRIEGDLLVGYGFGHQRVAVPRSSVKSLGHYSRRRYRSGPRQGLVVLDADDRVLLRAGGDWGGELVAFCGRAGLPLPQHRDGGRLWRRAPGHRRLRTSPRGAGVATVLITLTVLVLWVLGATAGVFTARLLPPALGPVRLVLAGLGLVAGIITGTVAAGRAVTWATSALKWTARSVTRSRPT